MHLLKTDRGCTATGTRQVAYTGEKGEWCVEGRLDLPLPSEAKIWLQVGGGRHDKADRSYVAPLYALPKGAKPRCSCFVALGFIVLAALTLSLLLSPRVYSAQITLAWDPNTEPDFAGYKLYYGHSSREYIYSVNVGNQTQYTLSGLEEDKPYFFAVTAYDIYGDESDFSKELKPSTVALFQSYPNPFNAATNISFGVLKRSLVKITIYNILGQLVRKVINREYTLGVHRVQWDGTDSNHTPVSSGVYFYCITTDTGALARKMIVLR